MRKPFMPESTDHHARFYRELPTADGQSPIADGTWTGARKPITCELRLRTIAVLLRPIAPVPIE